ncbi:MAG: exopolysaccharide biosynthesis polyprenyl glycosylphosphotransferase [Candidatus Doudnabacteria bacterium]|nr:exopolysaccharide biosynthesis polyprenyl glycosylphosphotransferase [Candidatus Doudnabacteria bacterium]
MKKSELIFNIISIPVDAIMLLLATLSSFYLRQEPAVISKPIIYQLNLDQLILTACWILPILILIFAFLGLYNLRGIRKFAKELGKVIEGISLALLLIILLFFFNQNIFPSRFIILSTWGLGIVFVVFGRLILKAIQRMLFIKGIGLYRLVVINGQGQESRLLEQVYKNPVNGYEIVKELNFSERLLFELEEIFKTRKFDGLLQSNPNLSEESNLSLVQFARNKGINFSFVPNLFEVQRNVIETSNLNGIPVIGLKNTPLDGWGKVAKRILDIIFSFFCLVVTSPLFLIIAIAIRLDSKGKIIYAALRGGKGKDFKCYKFRTMFQHLSVGEKYGGEQAQKVRQELWQKNDRGGKEGPFLKIRQDPRVTRVGRFLRRTKLDEIPQFWNVFKGDMSMVGPRAHVLDEVERYRNRYQRMFSIKPGIFGMSQIAQSSWPDLPFEEEIKQNTFYIENWSLWLDVKILAKSFWLLFSAKKSHDDY